MGRSLRDSWWDVLLQYLRCNDFGFEEFRRCLVVEVWVEQTAVHVVLWNWIHTVVLVWHQLVVDILFLDCGRGLDLVPRSHPILIGGLCAVWESSEPSGHTSLAFGGLVSPVPVFAGWKSWCASVTTICDA